MRRIKKLERDQIKSALFELRFDPAFDGLPDLLPGMLFASLGKTYPVVNLLPPSEMPVAVRQTMPNWQYMALRQMSSSDGRSNLNIAHSSVHLELIGGYPGWSDFRSQIFAVVDAIASLQVVTKFTRYSLRYQNILSEDVLADLSDLRFQLMLGGEDASRAGLQVRAEMRRDDFISIVTLASHTMFNVNIKGTTYEHAGALVDIDVIPTHMPDDFLKQCDQLVDHLHDREKEVFFGILSESTISRLGPVWEE